MCGRASSCLRTFCSKLSVTLVRDGANSYHDGIELEVEWVFR